MKRISITIVGLVVLMVAALVLTSFATMRAIYIMEPWQEDIAQAHTQASEGAPQSNPTVLRWDTPVLHEWRDSDGELIGSYTSTLYDYANDATNIGELERFDSDVSTVLHFFVTDPEMRGHLLRHGVTEAQIDALAVHFEVAPEVEAYLAFQEP